MLDRPNKTEARAPDTGWDTDPERECFNCKFSHQYDDFSGQFVCRRNAPMPNLVHPTCQLGEPYNRASWPEVSPGDWCGAHEPATPAQMAARGEDI